MRITKDGRIKIKYDELRVGMVLKWDDSAFFDKEMPYLMVNSIVHISDSTWFTAQ